MSRQKMHVVLVYGLDDGKFNFPGLLARVWNTRKVQFHSLSVGWRDGGSYKFKLQLLLDLIDDLLATGDPVTLIGVSAGVSLVVTAYELRPQIAGVATICGPVRLPNPKPRGFTKSSSSSPAFLESLAVCEAAERRLTANQRRRVLAVWGWPDGLVPVETMFVRGAKRLRVIGFNHSLNIVTALLFYRRAIVRFLSQSN